MYSYTTGEACSFPSASSTRDLVSLSYLLAIAIVLGSISRIDFGRMLNLIMVAFRNQTWHWMPREFATNLTNLPLASSEPSTLATCKSVAPVSGVAVFGSFAFAFMAFSFLCCVLVWDFVTGLEVRRIRDCNDFGRHGLIRQGHSQVRAICQR